MTRRIKKICERLSACASFVDVGCDHGFCTQYMLKNGLCERAIITDISAKSLAKAEQLLADYISRGACRAVCCDGLDGVDEQSADLVLIAGMGGEEIVKILKNAYIPRRFVFQPMKNARELREYLLEEGCGIDYDGIFYENRGKKRKYYFIISGSRQGEGVKNRNYSRAELAFGKDSLGTAELNELLAAEIEKNQNYLSGDLSEQSESQILEKIEFYKGVVSGEVR